MVTYKIHTGINGNSVDRIYVSTPKGVFNLKNRALGGIIELSENDFAKAMNTGLKQLIAKGLVKVETVNIVNLFNKEAEAPVQEPVAEEKSVEEPVEEAIEEKKTPERIVIVDDVPESKAKSKKRK